MISRQQAAAIARQDAIAHRLGFDIAHVLRPDEITSRLPSCYGVSLDACWVAYVEPVGPPRLCASTIVVIDARDGTVRYRGSAGDEG